MKIQKFFDKDGKEVEPQDAIKCHEIETDDNGKVLSEAWYFAEDEG